MWRHCKHGRGNTLRNCKHGRRIQFWGRSGYGSTSGSGRHLGGMRVHLGSIGESMWGSISGQSKLFCGASAEILLLFCSDYVGFLQRFSWLAFCKNSARTLGSSGRHQMVIWESSGGHLKVICCPLGLIWGSSGVIWGHLGVIWDKLGGIWSSKLKR